jgi:hypothetical protein
MRGLFFMTPNRIAAFEPQAERTALQATVPQVAGFVACSLPFVTTSTMIAVYRIAWENAIASAQFAWKREVSWVNAN